jgi:hypothetical protein
LSATDPVAEDPLADVKAALERSAPEEARVLVDRAYHEHPEDPEVREMYAALHLAAAIRLSSRARELRRQDIVSRDIAYDVEFEDGPAVGKAFDEAAAGIDDVLKADPKHEKALMMKASLVFRRNREKGRAEALEILQGIAAANPANRQVLYTIRKVSTPCPRCSDSGFCPRCRGRGSRRRLGFESKCEACHGQGICLVCGIL